MTAQVTKIKVQVPLLLAKVRLARNKMLEVASNDDYDAKKREWTKAVEKALKQALANLKEGNLPHADQNYRKPWHIEIPVPDAEYPQKPDLNTSRIDRDIAALEMAADPTIVIDANSDYAKYL